MTLYQKFKKLSLNCAAVGLDCGGAEEVDYFCMPRGVRIIGSAGVDGIHYCFVRGQGDMVFAVCPMNVPGQNVFPIARSFEDLLRLLLSCGSMAALDQVWMWDEEQFEAFIAENPPTPEGQAVLDTLRDKLNLTPMEEPYAYLRALQDGFDEGRLHFSAPYYEAVAAAPVHPSEAWRVTLEGGFQPRRGKSGREIPVNRRFMWGDEAWHVPAVYLFSRGAVVDFCIAVDMPRLRSHVEKVRAIEASGRSVSEDEASQLQRESPTDIDFRPALTLNGETLRFSQSSGMLWIPPAMTPDEVRDEDEPRQLLTHYGLDEQQAWVFRRCTFLRAQQGATEAETLHLHLERDRTTVSVERFPTPTVGESITLTHPVTGMTHALTVRSCEAQEVDGSRLGDQEWIFPTHFSAMSYTLWPELPMEAYSLRDGDSGDSPRPKEPADGGRRAMSVGAMAILRSTGKPEKIPVPGGEAEVRSICTSLHFEPTTEPAVWRFAFRDKLLPDCDVTLLP